MFHTVTRIIKWISIPALLLASVFSPSIAHYQAAADLVVCLGSIFFVQRAVRAKQYWWAAAFAAVTIFFSPLPLLSKLGLLMLLTCIATFWSVVAVFRRPAPAAALVTALALAIPLAGVAQTSDTLDVAGKLKYHVAAAYGPEALVGIAAYAAVLQADNAPEEWGQGGGAYGKRVASTAAWAGIHSALAFGLDSTLHQDPRYRRAVEGGFWRRTGHALRGTFLTRTDSGGETFSTWRVGSAYGAAFLSNEWYPDRLNTVRLGFLEGTVTLGFGFIGNVGSEFWPDIKRSLFRRK